MNMERREFFGVMGDAPAWPPAGHPQQAGKVTTIGYLAKSDRGIRNTETPARRP
jgi:hypothetical protein